MTEDEIQTAILQVCKVSGNDSDFNVLGFYTLCDRLVELGAAAEREACAKVCEEWLHGEWHNQGVVAAMMIRVRGQV